MTLTRRDVIATAGAAAATLAAAKSANAQSFEFKPNQRYPDTSVEILDPSFAKYRIFSSTLEQVATGMRWAEGPVWFGDGNYLLVSDIPNNRIMRYDQSTGNWGVFRHPSNFANGNARDRQGRLITCEHLTRRVTRTEYDGKITVLADNYNGKRLNSPNDIVCKSDGSIWFTDPPFGIGGDWEGDKANARNCRTRSTASRRTVSSVSSPPTSWARTDSASRRMRKSSTSSSRGHSRTGWCGRSTSAPTASRCRTRPSSSMAVRPRSTECGPIPTAISGAVGVLPVRANSKGEELDGVKVFNPEGKAIGFIRLPERCPNLAFGGPKKNRLFMASCHSLYALYVEAHGAV